MIHVDDYFHPVLNHRINQRMRELCEKALTDDLTESELEAIRLELLCLVHEKVNRLRNMSEKRFLVTDMRVHWS